MDPATLPSTPKPSLKAWLNNLSFAQRLKKETEWRPDDATPDGPVFGVPLKESLKHASVPISTATTKGDLYLWGTVPVVVAKCGNYLKNNAEVPGTFRINGSSRRTRDLQAIFEKPPEFGRKLNWALETYTTHDVASVFRRYLTHMPEPVIPHAMYHSFRDALTRSNFNENDVIATYQRLIKQMPRPNQHLLLYVLDLLSVFAQKSDRNLMTASNLAVIFRPGLISHPNHETSPKEFELSQSVLEFLIAHQDYFMLDIPSPPNGSVQSPRPQTQDAHVILSSSDEEISDLGPGNWRQISARPMSRRRTTTSRGRQHPTFQSSYPHKFLEDPGIISGSGSPVSPVPEHSLARPNAHDGIRRSRTMPVRKKGVDGEDPPRVLRKQRRVLATPRDEHISRN